MAKDKKQILGHVLACGTQIMWGATFVSTKVLLKHFLPVEVLFTRAVLAFIVLLIFYPHHLKLKEHWHEILFAGAGLFGIVLYFMLENTALTMTYASVSYTHLYNDYIKIDKVTLVFHKIGDYK